MIATLRFRYRLFRIELVQSKMKQSYDRDLEKAKLEKAGYERIRSIQNDDEHEWRTTEDEKSDLVSCYLLAQTRKHSLPIPGIESIEFWEDSNTTGKRLLTAKAQREMRLAIRAERKDRSENARLWLTGLTGLMDIIILLVLRRLLPTDLRKSRAQTARLWHRPQEYRQ